MDNRFSSCFLLSSQSRDITTLASDCGQRSRELCEKTAGRRVEICRRGLRFYEEYGKIERLCGLFRRGSGKLEESGTWNRNEENFPVR